MRSWPRISLVTPSYNHAAFLESTIRSVVDQNYPDIEYVVVDGGSTDNSAAIIERYASKLHWWVSERDDGQYSAINKGFAQTTGEIMGWINSDDFLFPTTLRLVGEIFQQCPEVEWITTLLPAFASAKGVVHTAVSLPGYSREAFLDGRLGPPAAHQLGWIQQESTFWRRSLWERCGSCIPLKYGLAADFHLWSLFFEEAPLYGVHVPLGVSRTIIGQRSKQGDGYVREMTAVFEEAKSRVDWEKSPLEQLRFLARVPLVRTLVKQRFGYQGRNLVMRDPELGGRWEVQVGKFG